MRVQLKNTFGAIALAFTFGSSVSTTTIMAEGMTLIAVTLTAESASAKTSCNPDTQSCLLFQQQQEREAGTWTLSPEQGTCTWIVASNPQAVVLRAPSGASITSWRLKVLRWTKADYFSELLGKDVFTTQLCAGKEVFAKVKAGAQFCGEIAKSEMNQQEARELATPRKPWSKGNPFCIMSQKDCRKIGMSWK